MANELQYYGDPAPDSGLTIIARVYDDAGAQVGTDVTCTESGTTAIYIGDMPAAAAGVYGVRFFDGTTLKGQGCIEWDGAAEINDLSIDTLIDGGLTLTPAERLAVSTQVEQSILDEADGNAVLNAIVGAIGNTNVDEIALVAAIRADMERAGGAIDLIETKAEADIRQVALIAEHDATQAAITSGAGVNPAVIAAAVWDTDMSLHTVAGSAGETQPYQDPNILAAAISNSGSFDVNVVKVNGVNVTSVFDFQADISGLETKAEADARQLILENEHSQTQVDIASLNDLSAADINTALSSYDAPTKAELDAAEANIIASLSGSALTEASIYTYFTSLNREDLFKADVLSGLLTHDAATAADVTAAVAAINANTNLASITPADVYAEFINGSNEDVFKADLTGIATAADVAAAEAAILAGQAGITATVDYNLIADAVWDEDMASHTIAGSAGETQPHQSLAAIAAAVAANPLDANIVSVNSVNVTSVFDFQRDINHLESQADADIRQAALLAEHSETQATLAALSNLSPADIMAALTAYDGATNADLAATQAAIIAAIPGVNLTAADIYTYFTAGFNADAFKANTTGLATAANVSSAQTGLSTQNTGILAAINGQNNLSAADLAAQFAAYDGITQADLDAAEANIIAANAVSCPSAVDIYTEFTNGTNADAFHADLTGVAMTSDVTTAEANILAGQVAQQAANAAALTSLPQDVWHNQPWEMMDNTVFVNGVLTSARIRHFPDAATAAAATDGGTAEGEIVTYLITSAPNGNVGEVLTYRKLKQ